MEKSEIRTSDISKSGVLFPNRANSSVMGVNTRYSSGRTPEKTPVSIGRTGESNVFNSVKILIFRRPPPEALTSWFQCRRFCSESLRALKKGLGGWPDLPYSRMLAILALELAPDLPAPSERGSAKPILTSQLPSRFCLAGESPRERSSSPVERLFSFVPLPTTLDRFDFTLDRTTSPPASSTLGIITSYVYGHIFLCISYPIPGWRYGKGCGVCGYGNH